jgi:hypothetical protein
MARVSPLKIAVGPRSSEERRNSAVRKRTDRLLHLHYSVLPLHRDCLKAGSVSQGDRRSILPSRLVTERASEMNFSKWTP